MAAEWAEAVREGAYRRSTRHASLEEIGFIHLSDVEQLPRVAAFLYRDAGEPLVVLELDSDDMLASGAHLVWEDGGGEEFPHLYGQIELPWVVAAWPAGFGADGDFASPLI
ncbi:MAG: DUF952 domain-containing protein [Acidobacteria bacterium]|nr:DUF952 domain-containing protein [Acidobacteriota bacterium]